jgi:hypothetical protein
MANNDRAAWWQVWVAIPVAVIALVAAGFSLQQANAARQQNTVSEQQELVTLVSDIAQDPQIVTQESEAFKGNQSALANAVSGTNFTELADSEEADYLIGLLHGAGVTAIEYYETALGIEASDSHTRALNLLNSAVQEATNDSDPRTLANAWYAEASISYNIGNSSGYSEDLTHAQNAFSASLGATPIQYDRNLIYLKFFDASYKAAARNCMLATSEINDANSMLKKLNISPSSADISIMGEILDDCPHA